MTTTASTRPRNRRESATSTTASGGPGRVRKNSLANGHSVTSVRPRANTISRMEGANVQLMSAATPATLATRSSASRTHNRHSSIAGLPIQHEYHQTGGMSSIMGQRAINNSLPKLETQNVNGVDYGGGLRTAPLMGSGFSSDFDCDRILLGSNSTINPNALHYSDAPHSVVYDATSPYHQSLRSAEIRNQQHDENLDWMNGFNNQLSFQDPSEHVIDGSSPSAMSTASQSGISEIMLDGSNNQATSSVAMWSQPIMNSQMMMSNPYSLDLNGNPGFHDMISNGPLSPHNMMHKNGNETLFSTPPPLQQQMSPSIMSGFTGYSFIGFSPGTPLSTVNNLSSMLPIVTITETTRLALLEALNSCSRYVDEKNYTYCMGDSHIPPSFTARDLNVHELSRTFPSSTDLQRFVAAYIQFFSPHLPFLHIPTLSFDVPNLPGSCSSPAFVLGDRGSLLLSMAAFGALYEMERVTSHKFFEYAKLMAHMCLEERRKNDLCSNDHENPSANPNSKARTTYAPIWLVQAMLLNVIYGYNGGDQVGIDNLKRNSISINSLVCVRDLLRPYVNAGTRGPDMPMEEVSTLSEDWWQLGIRSEMSEEHQNWYEWKCMEERKRTLYGAFYLSVLLAMVYNHVPVVASSDITLSLPCDEEFWAADTAESFYAIGGAAMTERNQPSFHETLNKLLRASDQEEIRRQQWPQIGQNITINDVTSEKGPSTFGCLILISAIHNYLWDLQQRNQQLKGVWIYEESEKMHRHIEPALKAWQAMWASNPQHSLERPNPYGAGPLAADSIPLLDLAYVRLYVDLSRSKERFWQRDWNGMAGELSRVTSVLEHIDDVSEPTTASPNSSEFSPTSSHFINSPSNSSSSPRFKPDRSSSFGDLTTFRLNPYTKNERHLRKAAFFAADSLSMSDNFGITISKFTSRDLPLHSALCAFDCAQILAEWVATVQDRAGQYLGILGKDDIDFCQVPAIMLLEDEDIKLLARVQEVLNCAEIDSSYELSSLTKINSPSKVIGRESIGWGSKILRMTAQMLERFSIWSGKLLCQTFFLCLA